MYASGELVADALLCNCVEIISHTFCDSFRLGDGEVVGVAVLVLLLS